MLTMFQSYLEMSFANLLGLRINLVGRLAANPVQAQRQREDT